MKIWTITTSHARKEVAEFGLGRYYDTRVLETEHYLLDHHYPIDYWKTRHALLDLGEKYNLKVVSNPRNLGGHEGFNWVFNQLDVKDEDFVIGFDPDANPMHKGWDKAMVEALQKTDSIVCVSLLIDHLSNNRQWTTVCEDPKVVIPDFLDMFNVTCWKGWFVRQTRGMKALTRLYGGVEMAMHSIAAEQGKRFGYLWDYREAMCPIPHDELYNKWKQNHLQGDQRNFDELVRDTQDGR